MKYFCAMVLIAVFCIVAEASPHRFYAPTTLSPRSIHYENNVLNDSSASSTKRDVRQNIPHIISTFGNTDNTLEARNIQKRRITTVGTLGGTLADNNNAFGDAITKQQTLGVSDGLTKNLNANISKNKLRSEGAKVFKSPSILANGFQFECNYGDPLWKCQWTRQQSDVEQNS